jgi:site-specific DNA-methyltransferase (adenine-specific)
MEKINTIYNEDCITGMQRIEDGSIDCILTDPPYLYLKNQKLDRPFDEQRFFEEAKRVLKKDGFIVLFGRGASFYRWNTRLADLGFNFKEEIIWNKSYITSPLTALSRVHEIISIHTKCNGVINKVKVPYLEMKGHDIDAIITDIKRLKTTYNNTKSMDALMNFLENNKNLGNKNHRHSIIRTDYNYNNKMFKYDLNGNSESVGNGDRVTDVMQSICFGMNEKSIIKQVREHYATIHPTQKPVRLLERLLALTTKEGDLILDPFSGSGSTAAACINTGRNFIAFEIDREYYEASHERTYQKNLLF